MASWPLDSIPPDWMRLRDRWEYAHATRAFLMLGALAALVLSIIQETPADVQSGQDDEAGGRAG